MFWERKSALFLIPCLLCLFTLPSLPSPCIVLSFPFTDLQNPCLGRYLSFQSLPTHAQAELFSTLPESLFWVWWERICEKLSDFSIWVTRGFVQHPNPNCLSTAPQHCLCTFCPTLSICFLGMLTAFIFVLWIYPFLRVCFTLTACTSVMTYLCGV